MCSRGYTLHCLPIPYLELYKNIGNTKIFSVFGYQSTHSNLCQVRYCLCYPSFILAFVLVVMKDPQQMKMFTTSSLFCRLRSCMVLPLSIIISLVSDSLISRPGARVALVTKSKSIVIPASFFVIKVVSCAYLRLFIILPLMDIPPVKFSKDRVIMYSP